MLAEWDKEYSRKLRFSAGVDYDVERVIYSVFYEFDENQEPRFSRFCAVWKESKLGLIFCGRDSFRDLYELSTEIFHCVKQYAKSIYKNKENNILGEYFPYFYILLVFRVPVILIWIIC